MFEILEDSSETHLLNNSVTKQREMENLTAANNFDNLADDLEDTNEFGPTVSGVSDEVNLDNIEAAMEAIHEAKDPPDKSDLGSILGETMESENSDFISASDDAQSNGRTDETVASLTSAFEDNVQTLMEKYTEQALKAVHSNKEELSLEQGFLSAEQEKLFHQPKLESDLEVQNIKIESNNSVVENKDEFVTFTLPKVEEDAAVRTHVPSPEFTVDPAALVREIIDDLIPAPVDPGQVAEELIDAVLDQVLLVSGAGGDEDPPPLVPLPSKRVRGKIYPPTFAPADRPGRVTNRLEYIRKKVLPAMFNHKDAWPFKTPVDSIKLNIPDYHNIVKNPMDLGTIKKRLVNRYYWNAAECQSDFKLMFGNCYLYNKPDYDIVKMCRDLEAYYDQKIESMTGFTDLEVESEKGFVVQKRKKKLPGEDAPKRKRNCYRDGYYRESMLDFEDDIPLQKVLVPYRKFIKPPKQSVKAAVESSSEESEEESEESESEEDLGNMMHRSYPSHLKSFGIPQYPGQLNTSDAALRTHVMTSGQTKTSDKKQKHLCKFCQQPFLSRTVRDMHEKHKHGGDGFLPSSGPIESSPQPVIKKVPPLKLSVKKSLQIVPVDKQPPKKPHRNGPQNIQTFPHPTETSRNNAFYQQAQTYPTQPYLESDMMNFVDKKHKAMKRQKNQSGQQYHRKPTQPKVQNTSKSSLSSIPEELLFPDTTPSFSKPAPGSSSSVRGVAGDQGAHCRVSGLHSPPMYPHNSDNRASHIISPPVNKFPKLSPDSGFPGSPDLLDHETGKLPGPPDMSKFVQNPSIIKHTDPRTQLLQQQQHNVMMGGNKIQRRFSASSQQQQPPQQQQQQQMSPQLTDRLTSGQTVINRKSLDSPEPAGFIQQRRISGGQQQQQQVHHIVAGKNGGQYVMSGGRPSIVQHSNIVQQQQIKTSTNVVIQQQQQQQQAQSGIPATVMQQQQKQVVSRVPSIVLQQQQPLPRPTTALLQQQQLITNSRPPAAVLQQQQQISRPQTAVLIQQQQQQQQQVPSSRPPDAVMQQVMARLPQQPVSRPASLQTSRPPAAVLQTSRPPDAVMSALASSASSRPISLQSRSEQQQLAGRPVMNVPLKLPTQPLPQQPVQQQQQQQQQPAKNSSLDVLAQTLKLSDLDFDFEPAEPNIGSSLLPPSETQELRLEDLKHLQNSSIPKADSISQLLDFSNITYQDVISAADTLTVYPGSSDTGEEIIFSSSSSFLSSSPVVQTSRPPNSVMVSSLDPNSVLFSTNSSSQDISDLMDQFR